MDNKRKNQPIHERPIGDILQSIDSFFNQTVRHFHIPRAIPVYQYETKKDYIIEAELPGIKKDQLTLDIYHNFIKISVSFEDYEEVKNSKTKSFKQSASFEKSERTIQLPFAVNESEVKAYLKDGVLQIRIPNKKKRIEIE
ncbi:Hsp20/alpha crystallin family protein [Bacillus shivajii]|uniref:Hsp20/alpha crystallin family protein n=1 Tax=Bacillus shivajii TaxID=1983719 RepID=UPI001CFB3349|nr:Hsp20/alpha crystallin family protein [Bacillus shivajii]UCZ51903.1 Hsp20/alpha crystallin family protein [Bacillus shivajii]